MIFAMSYEMKPVQLKLKRKRQTKFWYALRSIELKHTPNRMAHLIFPSSLYDSTSTQITHIHQLMQIHFLMDCFSNMKVRVLSRSITYTLFKIRKKLE